MDKIFKAYHKIAELMIKSGRDIDSATLKLVEELGEFTSANSGLKSYKKNTVEDLQEEVVDLLQCAMGLYSLVQRQYPFDGEAVMNYKLAKWESKYAIKCQDAAAYPENSLRDLISIAEEVKSMSEEERIASAKELQVYEQTLAKKLNK